MASNPVVGYKQAPRHSLYVKRSDRLDFLRLLQQIGPAPCGRLVLAQQARHGFVAPERFEQPGLGGLFRGEQVVVRKRVGHQVLDLAMEQLRNVLRAATCSEAQLVSDVVALFQQVRKTSQGVDWDVLCRLTLKTRHLLLRKTDPPILNRVTPRQSCNRNGVSFREVRAAKSPGVQARCSDLSLPVLYSIKNVSTTFANRARAPVPQCASGRP